MGFTYVENTKDIQPNVEINSLVNNKLRNGKPTEDVEIFSKMVWGKDVSKYGKRVDTILESVKKIAEAAVNGDTKSQAEINSITTVTLQQPLMQRLQINNLLGNATTVGYNEALQFTYSQLQGDMSRDQASSGAVVTPTVKKVTDTANTHTVSGGIAIDYRELASGLTEPFANAGEQVITSMVNHVVLYNITTLHDAVVAATTMKNYAAGITSSNVDAVLKLVRRWGNVSITGDYSAVSKLNDLQGFQISSTATDVRFSEEVMNEIRRTGLVKNYKGTAVVELPNSYNMTELNTAGTYYKPILPLTDLWFIPQGFTAPLQMVYRGGLTSMTGTDLNTRQYVTVYDLEHGAKVIPQYIPMIGMIYDSSLAE